MSGTRLPVAEQYRNALIHTVRQRDTFLLEDLLNPCAAYLRWHVSYIYLIVYLPDPDRYVLARWHRRLADRTRTPLWQAGEYGVVTVTVVLEAMPAVFPSMTRTDKECRSICQFGGCCRECQVLVTERGEPPCPGCGSGPGCCLSENCGCDCCRSASPFSLADNAPRCPFHGCQPEWAARGYRHDDCMQHCGSLAALLGFWATVHHHRRHQHHQHHHPHSITHSLTRPSSSYALTHSSRRHHSPPSLDTEEVSGGSFVCE